MATTGETKSVLSVCATKSNRLKELPIKNGQLVFIQDKCRIAFDYDGKRRFYNSIITFETDDERAEYSAGNDKYVFVLETAVLWLFHDGWIQVTTSPKDVLFVGVELPQLGDSDKLYIDTVSRNVSIWDAPSKKYVTVADKTECINADEIEQLFNVAKE